ncbi:MAG: LemA family protein [Deltaproteobacteria bacterium]|nr:LemA family protein [Deltaproteobacteria bacterium]
MSRIRWTFVAAALLLVALPGCGYNALQSLDEETTAAWSEVQNQYQRRFDLIPNLVNVVKGYAAHESETLTAVTEARAKVGQIKVTPEMLSNPQLFTQFQSAQSELGGALSRLMVVAEAYPDLKANENFRDLQAQLEGTENRITVARNRYIEAVKTFNVKVRQFPSAITAKVIGMKTKENFAVTSEAAQTAPKVQF